MRPGTRSSAASRGASGRGGHRSRDSLPAITPVLFGGVRPAWGRGSAPPRRPRLRRRGRAGDLAIVTALDMPSEFVPLRESLEAGGQRWSHRRSGSPASGRPRIRSATRSRQWGSHRPSAPSTSRGGCSVRPHRRGWSSSCERTPSGTGADWAPAGGRARSPDPDGEPVNATPTASRDPARDVAAGASFLSATRCSGARPRCPGRSTAAPSSSAATPPAAARSLTPRSSPLTTHSSANLPGRSAHRGRAVVSSASWHTDPRDHDDSFDLFVREPPEGDGEGHRRAGTRN